jgi:hypothetical protein
VRRAARATVVVVRGWTPTCSLIAALALTRVAPVAAEPGMHRAGG